LNKVNLGLNFFPICFNTINKMVYESLQHLNVYLVIVNILDVLKQMYLQLKIAQKRILVY